MLGNNNIASPIITKIIPDNNVTSSAIDKSITAPTDFPEICKDNNNIGMISGRDNMAIITLF